MKMRKWLLLTVLLLLLTMLTGCEVCVRENDDGRKAQVSLIENTIILYSPIDSTVQLELKVEIEETEGDKRELSLFQTVEIGKYENIYLTEGEWKGEALKEYSLRLLEVKLIRQVYDEVVLTAMVAAAFLMLSIIFVLILLRVFFHIL